MSADRPPGRVVAELGRPETPEETAARKAEDRRLHRVRQNTRNLVASLLVTVGVVVLIVAIVPRGSDVTARSVDYRSAAAKAEDTAGSPLLAPGAPSGWRANAAQLRASKGVTSWYIGFVTPQNDYVGMSEGIRANAAWLDDVLQSAPAGGTRTIGGLPWRVFDQRSLGQRAGNVGYALATRVGTTWLAVYGTAPAATEAGVASRVAAAARAQGVTGTAVAP